MNISAHSSYLSKLLWVIAIAINYYIYYSLRIFNTVIDIANTLTGFGPSSHRKIGTAMILLGPPRLLLSPPRLAAVSSSVELSSESISPDSSLLNMTSGLSASRLPTGSMQELSVGATRTAAAGPSV